MTDFWSRYKHYDPAVEGYGSAAEWEALADVIADRITSKASSFKNSSYKIRNPNPKIKTTKVNPDLETLLLEHLPETLTGLKTAFRNVLFLVHPDFEGGSDEATRNAIEAYQRLLRHYA